MKVYSVTDYGARPSCDFNSTSAIQAALDDCFINGGGTVEIPQGTYYVGSIRIRSNTTLHLLENAVLCGSINPDDYMILDGDKIEPISDDEKTDVLWKSVPQRENHHHLQKPGSRWNNAIIRVLNAKNVAIIGENGSEICGNDCFDLLGEEHYRGPHGINCHNSENIIFCGYTVIDSGNWAHCVFDCNNISVKSVKVYGGHDGFHFTGCNNTDISDCEFYTGDDCIAGFANVNASIKNCVVNSSCSPFRLGGTNVIIDNCRIYGPGEYLFRGILSKEEKAARKSGKNNEHINTTKAVFTYYADKSHSIPSDPKNIIIKNCKVMNVSKLMHYNMSGTEPWQMGTPLCEISFENIICKGITMPSVLYGDSEQKTVFRFLNCQFEAEENFNGDSFFLLCNYEKVQFENLTVDGIPDNFICRWSNDSHIDMSDIKSSKPLVIKEANTAFNVEMV